MIAIEQLTAIFGQDNVDNSPQSLAAYNGDLSFVTPIRPAFIVRPANADQVQQLIRLANDSLTPLVPVSSGPPHFRGDTVPGAGGSVIVDLNRMKQIMLVDRDRRVAMCEPGVTFGELIPRIREAGLRLNMPLLPRSTKSVVGSILEREPVTLPAYQWDISDPLACTGLCFGNGDEFRTGQAAGPGNLEEQWEVGGVQKAPYGPGTASLHRMVQGAQGTMGIVTWISMRCEILPSVESPFVVGSDDLEQLLEMAYWLIRQRMVTECFILNNTNMAAMFSGESNVSHRRDRATLPAWTLFYTVAGYEYFPEHRVAAHIEDISRISQRLSLEPTDTVGAIAANSILKAVQQPAADPYWKLQPRGGCHDVFYLTIREKLANQVAAMSSLAITAGYSATDMGVYIQPSVQGTNWHCEFNLFYNPANNYERNQIRALSASALNRLMEHGAFFSRPYGENADAIVNRDAATRNVLHTFKKIFDPNNVMNPGKVCF